MNPLNMYRETSIKTAGQGKLIVLLYDEAIKQVDRAISNLDSGTKKYDSVNSAIIRAQEIITELSASLDFEKGKDIASNLFSLYVYFNQQLMEANLDKDSQPIKPVRNMLFELRSAWKQIENTKDNSSGGISIGIDVAG
ncbi:MAG: flagellar export chaperone FliS [Spirochaetia bacterium]|jgi:flagellar protein FliS|nr:flagellar export chaperone FliS [Spirochaetia bacterium]